jgi:lysozyme
MLEKRLPEYNAEISKCIHVPVSDKTRAAFISFSYNVGSSAFCRSKIASRLNAGDAKGACDAMLAYDHAQGRVVKGLTNRRNAERRLCLEGVNEPTPKPLTIWDKIKLFFLSLFKGN